VVNGHTYSYADGLFYEIFPRTSRTKENVKEFSKAKCGRTQYRGYEIANFVGAPKKSPKKLVSSTKLTRTTFREDMGKMLFEVGRIALGGIGNEEPRGKPRGIDMSLPIKKRKISNCVI